VNLVDSLPFAISLARKTGAKVVYDSQEYFKGQYSVMAELSYNWVVKAETSFIKNCEIICATTNVLKEKLEGEYSLIDNVYLLRNAPFLKSIKYNTKHSEILKIVWHGLTIVPENTRGLHIILKAISYCKTPVHFYIQGNINETHRIQLMNMLQDLRINEKVTILKAAMPDEIVESLVNYDIGVAGELSTEENQLLTSSNKLFEYIAAGLALIVPNLPGIAETIAEFQNGYLFEQGNYIELSKIIDDLNNNRSILELFQLASKNAFRTDLNWENDYSHIYEKLSSKNYRLNIS
jgi:glycosyltransferase involved in cell wall biosynthesis